MLAASTVREWLVAVVVTAMAASMALLSYREPHSNAEATGVVEDLRSVARAALAYEATTGNWPPDGVKGRAPDELESFMEPVAFTGTARALEWDKFGVTPTGTGYIAGITLSTRDRRLMGRVIDQMRSEYPYFVAGNLVTWVLPERSLQAHRPSADRKLGGG